MKCPIIVIMHFYYYDRSRIEAMRMKKEGYKYRKVNAFTAEGSVGNPAAYVMLNEDFLSDEQMLKAGKEHAGFVSEIVFCNKSDKADVKLTYYSSECEVAFCGHGTIATMFDLAKNNEDFSSKEEISIETNKKGILTVYNRIDTDGAVYITAPDAIYMDVPIDKSEIAKALGVTKANIDDKYDLGFIDAGLRTLLVPLKRFETEISVYPDKDALKKFCENKKIDIILIFTMQTGRKTAFAHSRVFAPKFGYLEDPATGTGNSAFACYMLKNKMWDGSSIIIEQGGNNAAFNEVYLIKEDDKILFGGKAELRIDGEYYL